MVLYALFKLLGIFFKGFVAGIAIRFVIAVVLRSDATIKGFFRTGLVVGILYVILVLGRVYYIW